MASDFSGNICLFKQLQKNEYCVTTKTRREMKISSAISKIQMCISDSLYLNFHIRLNFYMNCVYNFQMLESQRKSGLA